MAIPVMSILRGKEANEMAEKAKAPYNFVRLNTKVVKPPIAAACDKAVADEVKATERACIQAGYAGYLKNKEIQKFSGYFDVDIENLTPLFMGWKQKQPFFFSNGEDICIAGSSLRGCLRHVFKIITNSAMRFENNEKDMANVEQTADKDLDNIHLYYRDMAGKSKMPTKDKYSKRMNNVQAGFLVKETMNVNDGGQYFILKSEYITIPSKEEVIEKNELMEEPKEPGVDWHDDGGYVDVYSGKMKTKSIKSSKKKYYRISIPNVENAEIFEVPEEVIDSYRHDKTRGGLSLIPLLYENTADVELRDEDTRPLGKFKRAVPCFFMEEGGKVLSFGANPFYRLPYLQSIGDHVLPELNTEKIDFTDAVFGKGSYWRSRIFVEDAYLTAGQYTNDGNGETRQILLSPKPTSFQFYLNNTEGTPNDWDDTTNIRGDKMYWHRKCDWRSDGSNDNENLDVIIKPVEANRHFCSKIRFENLDAVELGALASLFQLIDLLKEPLPRHGGKKPDICYKLGMGKPIGLGTVRLTADLYVYNDKKRYGKLFSGNSFADGAEKAAPDEYIEAFKTYLQSQLPPGDAKNYQERLKDLCNIMDFTVVDLKDWTERTRYLTITSDKNTLTNRVVLPKIEETIHDL